MGGWGLAEILICTNNVGGCWESERGVQAVYDRFCFVWICLYRHDIDLLISRIIPTYPKPKNPNQSKKPMGSKKEKNPPPAEKKKTFGKLGRADQLWKVSRLHTRLRTRVQKV